MSTHRIVIELTAREAATISAALGEYLYIFEEGNISDFAKSTTAFGNEVPLDAFRVVALRSKLASVLDS